MPRKKILFVIVEGPSDDAALSVLLSRFFDSNVVHVHVMHCDITTELGVTPNNIVRTIGDCVKKFAGGYINPGISAKSFTLSIWMAHLFLIMPL